MSASRTRPSLRRERRGAAVAVIVLLVLAVTGLGLLAMRQGQESITHGVVSTDAQRALQVADACAAGAVKAMPSLLDTYLTVAREGTGELPPIFHTQFDPDFFGPSPFGDDSPRRADCVVEILEIVDDAPAPGYSEGGGCFKRLTLLATAVLARVRPGAVPDSTDAMQRESQTVRQAIVRGLFGPVTCF